LTPIEPLPPHLAQKILAASPAAAMASFPRGSEVVPQGLTAAGIRTIPGVLPAPSPRPTTQPEAQPQPQPAPTDIERMREKKRSRFATVAPWLAAAACLALAIGAVLWATNKPPETVTVTETVTKEVAVPAPTPKAPPISEQRDQLLANAPDVTMLEWTATADPNAKGAKGDVVWSEREQRGYMRFVGLTPNDATKFQYQLWIFDKDSGRNSNDKFPVDGGVFDVSSTGEVIVPISARLTVRDATLFAVTIEKPGGVVVSARERIVVTAARKS
jgi:anti-sigma-K factor RskA